MDSFSGLDSSLSQPTDGITHDQGVAIGNSSPGNADISAVPQTEAARQPMDAREGNTLGSSSEAANEQREIEFVYINPQKENLETNLEEPFRSSILARFQSSLENHQQCILAMFPQNWEQDVTFSITVDRKAGFEIIGMFDLQPLPKVQSARGRGQQYSNMPIERLNLLGPSLHEGTVRN